MFFSRGNGDFSNPQKTTIDSAAESDELVCLKSFEAEKILC